MTVTLIVVGVAIAVALVTFALSAVPALPDPIEPVAEERAVVRALSKRPRLARFLRQRLDRRTAGGFGLTMSAVIVFGVAVVVGVLLDMVEGSSGLAAWDEQVAEWGAANATPVGVDVLTVITHLGGTPVVIAAVVAAGMSDYLLRRRAEVLVFLASVLIGEKLIVNGLKLLIDRDRPDLLPLISFSGASFPSGHTAAAAAVWPAVALVLGRGAPRLVRALLAAGAAVIAVAVAVSRALLGVHWLTDVIGGLAIGYGWFLICAIIFGGRAQRLGDPASVDPRGTADHLVDAPARPPPLGERSR